MTSTVSSNTALPPQFDGASASTILINGILIGTYFGIALYPSGPVQGGALVVGLAFFLYNLQTSSRQAPADGLSRLAIIGLLILAINVLLKTQQVSSQSGFSAGLKTALPDTVCLAMFVQLFLRHSRRPTLVILTLSIAFAWFGAVNLIADQLGWGSDYLLARTEAFSSRYSERAYRWQAPLYSSWQVSGMLRWALPVLLIAFIRGTWNKTSRVAILLAILVSTAVLVLCEYRASAIPLVGALFWLTIPSTRGRAVVSCLFLFYAVVAPILYATVLSAGWDTLIPDGILFLAGDQDFESLLSLSGRTDIWSAGVDILSSGKYLWLGQGHSMLDATTDIGTVVAVDPTLISRISYHQGLLDILFIYGTVPGIVLVSFLVAITIRGAHGVFAERHSFRRDEMSFALFSLGMVGLANCHDGFFVENNFFYMICIASLCALANAKKNRPSPNRATRNLHGNNSSLLKVPALGRSTQR